MQLSVPALGLKSKSLSSDLLFLMSSCHFLVHHQATVSTSLCLSGSSITAFIRQKQVTEEATLYPAQCSHCQSHPAEHTPHWSSKGPFQSMGQGCYCPVPAPHPLKFSRHKFCFSRAGDKKKPCKDRYSSDLKWGTDFVCPV